MKRPFFPLMLGGVLAAGMLAAAVAQNQPDEFRAPKGGRNSFEALKDDPFKGLTAKGTVAPGLFKMKSTGVSTAPVREAASAFIAGLTEPQRKKTLFPIDSDEWRRWDNRHFATRQGVGFFEMTEAQRKLAFELMRTSLSAKGLQQTRDVMKLNGTLGELTGKFDEYGEWFYWITIMGEPSATKPWGWQLDGHHAIINYFVLGDQVVMTPTFMGSEPIRAEGGKFKGTVVLQLEQDRGLALMQALDAGQQAKAIIKSSKPGNDTVGEAYKDNIVLDYAGLRVSEMNEAQKRLLLEVAATHIGNLRDDQAHVKLDEVKAHLANTYFAWIGSKERDGVFYYRIHSPVVLIEFDHQRPVALARSPTPTREHIHSVVRTPNGNDYGKDLLRQHYAQNPH